MSVNYVPVQWNRNKWFYDAVLVVLTGAYLWIFLRIAPGFLEHTRPVDGAIWNARAFGSCAFLMLTVILCIGPLARLDRRFLPLLYNRRHFGVITTAVAVTHAGFVLDWYFNFSPHSKFAAALFSNTAYDQFIGFPFEALGIFALLFLLILAATSHDFWLSFLTPRVWKSFHYLLYPAYAALVGHVALGALQDQQNLTFTMVVAVSVVAVCGLHLAAAWKETRHGDPIANTGGEWLEVCQVEDISEGRARIARLASGERVAVFRHEGKLSAIANACAHQNGPLGEGRVVSGCVTCPWHGFQYRLADGCSPEPFTEKVPTYRLRLENGRVLVDPKANPPGTYVEPVVIPAEAIV